MLAQTRFVKLVLALVMSGLCMAMLTLGGGTAQAAGLQPPTIRQEVCNDADVEGADGIEALAAGCVLRLRQPMFDNASPFGHTSHLSQTFIAPKTERVCRVNIYLGKGVANFGPVTLQIQTLGGAVLDSATIGGGAIPLGASWQSFNFMCDGGVLNNGGAYRLVLSAPQSPLGTYKWYRNTASVIPGAAFSRVGAGAWAAIAPAGTDFTFMLYMCS